MSPNYLKSLRIKFTFHYVSIKSGNTSLNTMEGQDDLHSTMFLLNRIMRVIIITLTEYLHSTMFLLNRVRKLSDGIREE